MTKPEVERAQLPAHAGSSRHDDQIPQTFELGRADPVDLKQIFDPLKRTVLLAVFDDFLGQDWTDPGKSLQLRCGGGVQFQSAFTRDRLRPGGCCGFDLQRDLDPLSICKRLGEVQAAEIGLRLQPARRGDRILQDRPGRERIHIGPCNCSGHMDSQRLGWQEFDGLSPWLGAKQSVDAPQQQSNQDSSN